MSGPIHEFTRIPAIGSDVPHGRVLSPGAVRSRPASATAPCIGVIFNPRSHRNRAGGERIELPGVMIAEPADRDRLPAVLADLAARGVNYLIIDGGDGTVRDVLTSGQAVFGDEWPVLAVLPKGKTNALNIDLGAPADWSLADAIAAHASGRRVHRKPLQIVADDAGDAGSEAGSGVLQGFILGAGAFTTGIQAGQDAHRMGAFNSLAVGMTVIWAIMQALFGSATNKWRRGVPMEIRLGSERRPMQHSGHGAADRRDVLLATTLERLPAGIKLFGKGQRGLKLFVMDKMRRPLVASLPATLFGYDPPWLAKAGFHRIEASEFALDVGGQFILDGEAFPAGRYVVREGPELAFVVP